MMWFYYYFFQNTLEVNLTKKTITLLAFILSSTIWMEVTCRM